MDKAKYKVGDRVRIVDKWGKDCGQNWSGRMDKWLGKVMTIRAVKPTGNYRMEEDNGEYWGNGWIWNDNCIAGYADEIITIARHGNKVIAKHGKRVGVAKCSPDDEFNFAIGAKLAFERLMGKSDEKTEPKKEFMGGECAEIIGNMNHTHNFPIGSIVRIRSVNPSRRLAICYGVIHLVTAKYGRESVYCEQCVFFDDIISRPDIEVPFK